MYSVLIVDVNRYSLNTIIAAWSTEIVFRTLVSRDISIFEAQAYKIFTQSHLYVNPGEL